jgi:hypothetical protein
MKNRLFGCLAATVLGAAVVLPTSAMAFRGGGGFGGGGMHGGFGGGGFGGGMHGGFGGSGTQFGGGGFAGGDFRGGMVTGRSAFVVRAALLTPPSPAGISSSTDLTGLSSSTSSTDVSSSTTPRSLVDTGTGRTITTMPATEICAGATYGPRTAGSGPTSAMVMAAMFTVIEWPGVRGAVLLGHARLGEWLGEMGVIQGPASTSRRLVCHRPFAHLMVPSMIPHCVGPRTRSCAAMKSDHLSRHPIKGPNNSQLCAVA